MAAHASAPFVVSRDDHEVEDNYAGDIDQKDTPRELFVLRRAAAYQAYYEHMPLRAPAFPSGSHLRLHRRLHFGSLIDLSVLETRHWRSGQACGDGNRTDCAAAPDPARTMLGAEQSMRAEFKVLDAVSRPDQPVRVGGTLVVEAGRAGLQT